MIAVTDALGRAVSLDAPARRVVSLVPSETESVVSLVGPSRLVGRTEYCVEPAGLVEAVPSIGGTKKIDVEAVLALDPDLVLANREENARRDVEALSARGLTVHVSFPQTVADTVAYLEALARLLGVDDAEARSLERALADLGPASVAPVRVFAPIWREPWMTFDGRTYASDLLEVLGAHGVFADRPRRYPLAADLGRAEARDAGERDTRYPRTSIEEILARDPELVLLPDEPYAFDESHAAELRRAGLGARVVFVSGKDLFWYGVRTRSALERLSVVCTRGAAAARGV